MNGKRFGLVTILFFTLILVNSTSYVSSKPNAAYLITIQPKTIPKSVDKIVSEELNLLLEDEYHNLSAVYAELENFNNTAPDLIDYSSIGLSYWNNTIPLITVTNEMIPEEVKGKTYVVAHHHGREQITIEHTLRTIRDLANEYSTDESVTTLLDRVIVYFIVTLNPDALDYTLYESAWHRKNFRPIDDDGDGKINEDPPEDVDGDGRISEYAIWLEEEEEWFTWKEGIDNDSDGKLNEDWMGGVDLNRNYPFHWNDSNADSGSTSDKLEQDYPGPAPLSEYETQALVDFVSNHNFVHALSLHSGTNATLFDWSYTNEINQSEASLYDKMLFDFQRYLPSSFFFEENEIDYTVAGGWDDWTYASQRTIPCTIEIYHQGGSNQYFWNSAKNAWEFDTIFEYFNPPKEKIDALHQEVYKFTKHWISLTPTIEVTSPVKYTLEKDENEIIVYLTSGSKYFNTTDDAHVSVEPSVAGAVKDYASRIGAMRANPPDTFLKIVLNSDSEIPDQLELEINVTSEWASDLSFEIIVNKADSRQTPGFATLITFSTLIMIAILIRKKRTTRM